jgi:hypothetical protein
MHLHIDVKSATFESARVTVTCDVDMMLNTSALRRLVLQEVARTLGLATTHLPTVYDATGYSVHDSDQWTMEKHTDPAGDVLREYTVRVPTPEQKEAKLRRDGGMIPLADGSYGFVLPERRP